MEFNFGTDGYYKRMLELQEKLRKSEEERLKLEEKFHEIMQHSRDAEHERLRIMRHKYHKFLEEDKARQERNENILQTLDRIDSRAKTLAAKTDRFKAFRKQYFENYLKRIQLPKQQENTKTQYRPQHENVRRKLFSEQTTTNETVENKLALLEQYLRDNFENFPRDYPTTKSPEQNGINETAISSNGITTRDVTYNDKKYFDDKRNIDTLKHNQEMNELYNKYLSRKEEETEQENEFLGNVIEKELERLRNKKEKEPNNNSIDAKEINSEQFIDDYKNLVKKSEEKYELKTDAPKIETQPESPINIFDNVDKTINKTDIEKIATEINNELDADIIIENKLEIDILEQEENSEETKPPTDISLNLSPPSLNNQQFEEQQQPSIQEPMSNVYEEYEDNSYKTEENISQLQENNIQMQDDKTIEEIPDQQINDQEFELINQDGNELNKTEDQSINQNVNNFETEHQNYEELNIEETAYQPTINEENFIYPENIEEQKMTDNQIISHTSFSNEENTVAEEHLPKEFGELIIRDNLKAAIGNKESPIIESQEIYHTEQEFTKNKLDEQVYQQEGYENPNNLQPTSEQIIYDEQDGYKQEPSNNEMYPTMEYSPENYTENNYPPQNYEEQVYTDQSFTQGYEAQQYDHEKYEQQYPDGYQQEYTEEQLQYNAELTYTDGDYEASLDYNAELPYSNNMYQTGQEYLQGEQNIDMQYQTEQTPENVKQEYQSQPPSDHSIQGSQLNIQETIQSDETPAASPLDNKTDENQPLVQKTLPNLADMLETDSSESVKQDTKPSSSSDFTFSNE